jgi:hypothetical protein
MDPEPGKAKWAKKKKKYFTSWMILGGPIFVPMPRKSFIIEFYLRRKYFHDPESGTDSAFSQKHISRSRTH